MTDDLARRDGLLYAAQAHTHELAGHGDAVYATYVDKCGVVTFHVHDKYFVDVAGALDLRIERPHPYAGGIHWSARGVRAGDHGQAIEVVVSSYEPNVAPDAVPRALLDYRDGVSVGPEPAAAEQFEAHQSGQFGSKVVPSWVRD